MTTTFTDGQLPNQKKKKKNNFMDGNLPKQRGIMPEGFLNKDGSLPSDSPKAKKKKKALPPPPNFNFK